MISLRFVCALLWTGSAMAAAPHVAVTDDHLFVDGTKAPYLYGAEVQYFRARGGPSRNVPETTVVAIRNRLLDRVAEAKMNTVTFYIPWDFHEPVEGVFDFDGKLDQDRDGKPDYPSRNLKLLLQLVQQRGIRNVMVRPGPYINAEWGPEGFGAIPLWFLNRYQASLAVNQTPGKPRVVSFADPIFRDRARRWMTALHQQVLKDWIGPGKPVTFLQLDNETNYFWDSVYERDRGPVAMAAYRAMARRQFGNDLAQLNAAYGASLASFDELQPPASPKDKTYGKARWHYDWYQFHDQQIAEYHRFLREIWESLGVREPDVLFTTCDSFNAAADHGLLPRLDYRGENRLSLSTMNIYPKTAGKIAESTLNQPFKAAHDAALFAAAHGQIYGAAGNWVMSTETVGGWFPKHAEVNLATRQHTYGSLLGSSVKALIIYYFHEGYNWNGLEKEDDRLDFDAPLQIVKTPNEPKTVDDHVRVTPSYELLKSLGAALASGLGEDLVDSKPVTAPVLLAHDNYQQYPIPGGPDALKIASDDSGALFGLLREAGYQPEVKFLDRLREADLEPYRALLWNDTGYLGPITERKLKSFSSSGRTLITIGAYRLETNEVGQSLHFPVSPAAGWNSDEYPRLKDASRRLSQIRNILWSAGIQPLVRVRAQDNQPFVHAWLRQAEHGKLLLFVENFLRQERQATIALSANVLGTAANYQVAPRWNARGPVQAIARPALSSVGVILPVSADGVDVWEIAPR